MSDILPRLLLSIVILGISLIGYRLVNAVILARSARSGRGLESFIPGIPGILYFTMEDCMPCRTTQRPALQSLLRELGEGVQIIEVDVVAQLEVAKSWGIVSVPTTVIVDRKGKPRQINHGIALVGTLLRQLQVVDGLPAVPAAGD